jgi:hypothetical protein
LQAVACSDIFIAEMFLNVQPVLETQCTYSKFNETGELLESLSSSETEFYIDLKSAIRDTVSGDKTEPLYCFGDESYF